MLISTNDSEFFDYSVIIPKDADEDEVIQWGLHRVMELFIDGRFQDGASMRDVRLLFLDAKPFTARHYEAVVELGTSTGIFTVETDEQPHKPGRDRKVFRAGVGLHNFREDRQKLKEQVRQMALGTAEREIQQMKKALGG